MSKEGSASNSRKQRLKKLLDRGEEIENTLAQKDLGETLLEIHEVITASNAIIAEGSIQDRREHTTEVVMDAQVVRMNHELVSKVFQRSTEFNDQMYLDGLLRLMQVDEVLNWEALRDVAISIAQSCRIKSSMSGAVETQRKEPTMRARRTRSTMNKEEERPQLVENMKRGDKGAEKINEVHKQVAQLFQKNKLQSLPWYRLIIDPHSFMNTVENAFQVAFLARDHIVGVCQGDDGYPEVRLVSSDEAKPTDGAKQNALTLNYETCERMIEFYNIKEAMLKLK